MAITTEYHVHSKYTADDNASAAIKRVGDSAASAGRQVEGLGSVVRGLGLMWAGGKLFGVAKSHFVDFNSRMEQAKVTMAGMLMLNKGGTFNANMKLSVDLVGQLQQRAKASVGTTQDFVSMAGNLVAPLSKAHASMKDIEDVTAGAVLATKAFGVQSEVGARDIAGALAGHWNAKDVTNRMLLEPMGFEQKSFNAMSAEKRMKAVIKAFKSPAIAEMAKAQENSFEGITSTLSDNLDMTLGKVGLPLFKAITDEVKQWNAWFDKNPEKIAEIGKALGDGLMGMFKMAKGAMSLIYDNRDLLMTLAKAWMIGKGVSMVGGAAGSAMNFTQNLAGGFGLAADGSKNLASSFAKAGIAVNGFTTIATLSITAGMLFHDWLVNRREKREAEEADKLGTMARVNQVMGPGYGMVDRIGSGAFGSKFKGRAFDQRHVDVSRHQALLDAVASGELAPNSPLMRATTGQKYSVSTRGLAVARGRGGDFDWANKDGYGSELYKKSIGEILDSQNLLRLVMADNASELRRNTAALATAPLELAKKVISLIPGAEVSAKAPNAKPSQTTINVRAEVSSKDPDRWIKDLEKIADKANRTKTRAKSAPRRRNS